ncbi:hypothetical protein PFICI_06653 [Pestalotiopsis fici W106-1]|uniref:Uncharacterized protein n=1 Tax=Pestalotiopsis fici (strain W106-1 / CGMCC3.15140) TaxID=1229662 RepID=W3X901_PESFW|nr:uncharacterized protein PFICI_06653 [Pestalotiopsis fici W106-1]ETS81651.1 hypothetical protein PFICI_06653 [Pestalotiopsis fici W106-1]
MNRSTKEVRFSSDMARPTYCEFPRGDEDNWPMAETFLLPETPSASPSPFPGSGSRSRSRSRSNNTQERMVTASPSPSPMRSSTTLRQSFSDFGDGAVLNPANKAFVATVNLAARSTTRGPVQALWNLILYSWFPPSDYIVCFPETGVDNGVCVSELRWVAPPPASFMLGPQHSLSVSTSTFPLPGPAATVEGNGYFGHRRRNPSMDATMSAGTVASAEPCIFMVQCWSSAADTSAGWRAAREAFARYLYARVAPGRRMLCAIAVGARCEVYGWDGAMGSGVPEMGRRHRDVLDLCDIEGRILLENQLAFVEKHGLIYAKATREWSARVM